MADLNDLVHVRTHNARQLAFFTQTAGTEAPEDAGLLMSDRTLSWILFCLDPSKTSQRDLHKLDLEAVLLVITYFMMTPDDHSAQDLAKISTSILAQEEYWKRVTSIHLHETHIDDRLTSSRYRSRTTSSRLWQSIETARSETIMQLPVYLMQRPYLLKRLLLLVSKCAIVLPLYQRESEPTREEFEEAFAHLESAGVDNKSGLYASATVMILDLVIQKLQEVTEARRRTELEKRLDQSLFQSMYPQLLDPKGKSVMKDDDDYENNFQQALADVDEITIPMPTLPTHSSQSVADKIGKFFTNMAISLPSATPAKPEPMASPYGVEMTEMAPEPAQTPDSQDLCFIGGDLDGQPITWQNMAEILITDDLSPLMEGAFDVQIENVGYIHDADYSREDLHTAIGGRLLALRGISRASTIAAQPGYVGALINATTEQSYRYYRTPASHMRHAFLTALGSACLIPMSAIEVREEPVRARRARTPDYDY